MTARSPVTRVLSPAVLDDAGAAKLFTELWGRLPAEAPQVELDCQALRQVEPAAASAIESLATLLRESGGAFTVVNLTAECQAAEVLHGLPMSPPRSAHAA